MIPRILMLITLIGFASPADAGIFQRIFGSKCKQCRQCSIKSTEATESNSTPSGAQVSSYYKGPLQWGRWCNKQLCTMCERIEAHNRSLGLEWPRSQAVQTVSAPTKKIIGYRTEEYRTQVGKRCINGKCYPVYGTRTRQVPIYETDQVTASKSSESDAINEATPIAVIESILGIVNPNPGQMLYDLGCGDARVLERALKDYGCRVYGCEIDGDLLAKAKQRMSYLDGWWKVDGKDATELDLADADVVYAYQFPDVLGEIRWETLRPGAQVVSLNHPIDGLAMESHKCEVDGKEFEIFVHRKPYPTSFLADTVLAMSAPPVW